MATKSVELREKRAKLIADARAVYTEAETAKREPNAEERSKFDKLLAGADELKSEYERLERLEAAEAELTETRGRKTEPNDPGSKPNPKTERSDRRGTDEYRSAFNGYLVGGLNGLGPVEQRALQADSDVLGGAMVPPTMFVTELIKAVDDMVHIRQWATKHTLTDAQSLGAASLDADPADADWTSELSTGNEDSTMAFGRRELKPNNLAKRLKVSQKLLRLTSGGAETLVRNRLAYKFGITHEKAFLTGNGAGRPLGVFTASANGISTGRDVSSGNTTTSIGVDGLISAKYSLKQQYQQSKNTRWMFHRDGVAQIAKLKDTTNQYLWQPAVKDGQHDTLLGIEVAQSEYAPNTFTTGLYVGILGDFSHYWIVDALTMTVQRLNELYAETGRVGFIGNWETDGMPVLEEAFARVKLA